MNRKGFFTAIISLIIMVLIVTMLSVQQNASKQIRAEYYQRAIFELKTGTQSTQYLLDKSASDAIADSVDNENCTLSETDYTKTIEKYFNGETGIIERTKEFFGIECEEIIVPNPVDISDFQFDLKCYRDIPSGFRAEYTTTIQLSKEATVTAVGIPPVCKVQVKDLQSGTCDALINKTICE